MKMKVKIEGLDCPNCARALQNEINKLDGVENANIDFLKSEITFESDNVKVALDKIINVTRQLEPNAKIIIEEKTNKSNFTLIFDIIMILIGITLGVLSITLKLPVVLFWLMFMLSVLLLGYKTYYKALKLIMKGVINENLLLTLSVIGAAALGEFMESFMVIGLYSIGKIFEGLAVDKSRKSIKKLTNLQPEYAVIIKDGEEERVEPKVVNIGSIIVVKPGERVPIDGKVLSGFATLDMQCLTGESLPVEIKENENIMSGSIVLDGVLKIETISEYSDSTVSRIMNLIEHASEKKSKTETLISKITRWYTLGVILCALLVWGIVWAVTNNFSTAIYRGLIFLVVSCPCAFAISVPLAYFSGIGNASRHGILIKGSNYLDACAKLKIVAFDKTGTLTTGKFVVDNIKSFDKNLNEEDIIYLASLGEQNSLHPLAKSIVEHNSRELKEVKNVKEIAGEGVYYSLNKDKYFVGRKNKSIKATIVEVFKNDKKIGEIELSDMIKSTSKVACQELKRLNIETVMLSGDNDESVNKVVSLVGIDKGYSNLLPKDKYDWIDSKKVENIKIGYVGDGINDSPSLMLSDVGISMGINGSPSSIEASDIVLVDDNPAKVSTAIKISKFTGRIVWENIILSAVIKVLFLILGSFGITGMLSAVFADVGVTVLAILNSMRALLYSPNKINKNLKKQLKIIINTSVIVNNMKNKIKK